MSGAVEGVALLPCPWCQSEALQILHNENLIGMEAVSCRNCGARGPHVETGKQATDGWNTRTTPPARSYADGVSDVVNLCRQWSEPGAKVLSSMSGLTDAEHAIAQRTAEGIAEAASGLLSQGGKA